MIDNATAVVSEMSGKMLKEIDGINNEVFSIKILKDFENEMKDL